MVICHIIKLLCNCFINILPTILKSYVGIKFCYEINVGKSK